MGHVASKLRGQLITRPLQRFNLEARTETVMSREKPTPAPKFASDVELLEQIRIKNPEIVEEIRNQNPALEERLKQVFVTSKDPPYYDPDIVNQSRVKNPLRPLPQKFKRATTWKGFYTDPERHIPKGKLSLELAQEFLSHFKQDPSPETIPILAEKYRIDLQSAEAFVEHYRVFYLYRVQKDEDVARRQSDPYLAQPDWVDADDDQPKKVLPVQPVELKPLTRETLRIGEASKKPVDQA